MGTASSQAGTIAQDLSSGLKVMTGSEAISNFKERMDHKMQSVAYRPELFLYLVVEELLVMFNARGVLLQYQQHQTGNVTLESNLLPDEYDKLLASFAPFRDTQHHANVALFSASAANAICWEPHTTCARSQPLASIPNSNLRDVDTEITIPAMADEDRLILRLWLSHVSSKADLVTAFTANLDGIAHTFEGYLSDLLKARVRLSQSDRQLRNLLEGPQQKDVRSFLDEKRRLFLKVKDLDSDAFLETYSETFQPLELLTQRITFVIHRYLSQFSPGLEYNPPIVYSFRQVGEKQLSFFLTADQLRQLLNGEDDRLTPDMIVRLLEFPFTPGIGLSGYVLTTGHSDLTAKPHGDPRWDMENATLNEREQLALIDRMYRILGAGSHTAGNENVFLLPLYVRTDLADSNQGRSWIQMLMECTLPKEESHQLRLREELLHLQWEAMPIVESAVLAQQASQLRVDTEITRYITTHAWTLGHNFPKFLSKPIVNISDEIETLTEGVSRRRYRELDQVDLSALGRVRDLLAYLRFMADHYSRFFAFFVHSLPGGRASDRIVAPANDEFRLDTVRRRLQQFVVHYRDTLIDTTRSSTDGTPCAAYQRLRVRLDGSKIPKTPALIYYNEALFMELVINHVANAMDELAKSEGQLVAADAARGEILIDLDVKPTPSLDSSIAFLVIRIVDHGPGMPATRIEQWRETFTAVFHRGQTPQLQGGLSTKAEHSGSGFLINAHILRSFRDSALGQAGDLSIKASDSTDSKNPGLTVTINLPVRLKTPLSSDTRLQSQDTYHEQAS